MDEDHNTAEGIWRRKTDAEVTAAAAKLDEYTEEGRQIIRNEVDRRHLTIEDIHVAAAADVDRNVVRDRRIRGAKVLGLGFIVFFAADLLPLPDSDPVSELVRLVAHGLQLYGLFALITGWRATSFLKR